GIHPAAAFYLPSSRLWELLMGAGLAYVTLAKAPSSGLGLAWGPEWLRQQPTRLACEMKAIVGLLMLIGAIAGLNSANAFPGWWALLPATGALLIISAGAQAWVNRVMLSHRSLVFVGAISYPLYLW